MKILIFALVAMTLAAIWLAYDNLQWRMQANETHQIYAPFTSH